MSDEMPISARPIIKFSSPPKPNEMGRLAYTQHEDGSITIHSLSPGVCVTMRADGVFIVGPHEREAAI